MLASRHPRVTPSPDQAMPKRVCSMQVSAVDIPLPTGPSWLDRGMRQSRKNNWPVSVDRQPSLLVILVLEKPGVPLSTTKVEIPRWPLLLSVWATTTAKSATVALVIQVLFPFRTQESPSRTAEVSTAVASLPTLGSTAAVQPMIFPWTRAGTYFFFCSSVPAVRMGMASREVW